MEPIRPRGYVCYRAGQAPKVDGRLEDAAWKRADWTEAFVDIEGDRKPKPRLETRVKMLWDDRYFYIGGQLSEPHVWGKLTQHDSVIFHDNDFEVFIDPNGDNHEYYEFEINALNTGWDLFLNKPYKDGGKADNRWEIPGLKTAIWVDGTLNDPRDTDRGWSVEIAIPWKVLAEFSQRPSPPQNGDQWRVNYSRVQWRTRVEAGGYEKIPKLREDNWVWSPQGIIDMHRPERWGYVQFSTRPPGTDAFRPDPSLPVRDALMRVYHSGKAFHQKHRRWPSKLAEFLPVDERLMRSILYQTREGNGFSAEATLEIDGEKQIWQVREDSRIRRKPAP